MCLVGLLGPLNREQVECSQVLCVTLSVPRDRHSRPLGSQTQQRAQRGRGQSLRSQSLTGTLTASLPAVPCGVCKSPVI